MGSGTSGARPAAGLSGRQEPRVAERRYGSRPWDRPGPNGRVSPSGVPCRDGSGSPCVTPAPCQTSGRSVSCAPRAPVGRRRAGVPAGRCGIGPARHARVRAPVSGRGPAEGPAAAPRASRRGGAGTGGDDLGGPVGAGPSAETCPARAAPAGGEGERVQAGPGVARSAAGITRCDTGPSAAGLAAGTAGERRREGGAPPLFPGPPLRPVCVAGRPRDRPDGPVPGPGSARRDQPRVPAPPRRPALARQESSPRASEHGRVSSAFTVPANSPDLPARRDRPGGGRR